MSRLSPALAAACTSLAISAVHAQTCTDPLLDRQDNLGAARGCRDCRHTLRHAQMDATGAVRPAVRAHDCTPRADRELTVYAVTGWARSWHIENGPKGDLDWHIELTQSAKTTSSKCVVVEIPDPQYGTIFAKARQDFLDLIVNSTINQKSRSSRPSG